MTWFKIWSFLAAIVGIGFQSINMILLPFYDDLVFKLMPVFMGFGFLFVVFAAISLVCGWED